MSERSPDTRDAYDAHGTAFMQLRGPALQPLEEQLASDVLRMHANINSPLTSHSVSLTSD